jgi:hypothetical protein
MWNESIFRGHGYPSITAQQETAEHLQSGNLRRTWSMTKRMVRLHSESLTRSVRREVYPVSSTLSSITQKTLKPWFSHFASLFIISYHISHITLSDPKYTNIIKDTKKPKNQNTVIWSRHLTFHFVTDFYPFLSRLSLLHSIWPMLCRAFWERNKQSKQFLTETDPFRRFAPIGGCWPRYPPVCIRTDRLRPILVDYFCFWWLILMSWTPPRRIMAVDISEPTVWKID